MQLQAGQSGRDLVAICVKLFKDLDQELQTASNAIAHNRLRDLEESLWRQETLCGRLKRAVPAICRANISKDSIGHLCEAAERLRMRSQIYEKLVAQAIRSTAILQHLCSLYCHAAQNYGTKPNRCVSREA